MISLAVSWQNFKAIVFSFLGLLPPFNGDILDGNMAVLVKCHKVNLYH